MMSHPEISVYRHPNPEMRSFFTSTEISAQRVIQFSQPLDATSEKDIKSLGRIGAQVVRELMAIPGVKKIRVKPKEIRMTREGFASWTTLEERVFTVLRRAFRRKEIQVVKPTPKPLPSG